MLPDPIHRFSPRRWGLAVVWGRSMLPTLHEGDRLLVHHGAEPRVGDLVVVRLAVANGPVVAVKRATRREPDGWWVESDNLREGVDSWRVGTVSDRDVVAVVRARIWPPRRVAH